MAGDIIIKKLEAANLDQVSRFRMGDPDDKGLQNFIRRDAKKSADASLTKTYVAKLNGDKKVVAYISIMCAEVKLEKTYPIEDKVGADRWEYHPAVRIARLATCDGHKGNGIAPQLVQTILGIVLLLIEPHAGCRFLIVDAKRKAVSFYQKLGFRLLDTEDNRTSQTPLMFMDLKKVKP